MLLDVILLIYTKDLKKTRKSQSYQIHFIYLKVSGGTIVTIFYSKVTIHPSHKKEKMDTI